MMVVLAWDGSDDPKPADGGDVVVALRPHIFAQSLDGSIPLGQLLAAVDRGGVEAQSATWMNTFRREMMRRNSAPWRGALASEWQTAFFFYLGLWNSLLKEIARRWPGVPLRVRAPVRWTDLPASCFIANEVLDCLLHPIAEGLGERAHGILGALLDHVPAALVFKGTTPAWPASPLVLGGLQATDLAFQRPLTARLAELDPAGLAWLVDTFDAPLSADEAGLTAKESSAVHRLDISEVHVDWRLRACAGWDALSARRQIAAALARVPELPLSGGQRLALAERMVRRNRDLRPRYTRVARALGRLRPRLVVGFSTSGDMHFVRAWCRSTGCVFARLPHGYEYTYHYEEYADADYLGVMGTFTASRLPPIPAKVFLSGGLQFQQQSGRPESIHQSAGGPWRALHLGATYGLWTLPVTDNELLGTLRVAAQAVAARGGRLAVRAHPRAQDDGMHRRAVDGLAAEGFPVEHSDPALSLAEDLSRSRVALIQMWSGAGMVALYQRLPLIGFVPPQGPSAVAAIVRDLPLHAESAAEFDRALDQALDEAGGRAAALAAQEDYLARHIHRAREDGYGVAVEALREVWSDVKARAC